MKACRLRVETNQHTLQEDVFLFLCWWQCKVSLAPATSGTVPVLKPFGAQGL